MINVYPKDEESQHDLTGTDCPCGPRVNWTEAIVVHRSWNGRELIEEAEAICANGEQGDGAE